MKILIDYLKREIRLTDERLAHIREHPEMMGLESDVEMTLQFPDLVVRSRTDFKAMLYYRTVPKTPVGPKWLCTVVKEGFEDAFVLTAYLTDRPKKGEILWPSE